MNMEFQKILVGVIRLNRLQIGEVISKLRRDRGITQDELGTFMGVSTAAVSKWESSTSYPDITLLPKLAHFFGVSIDFLLSYKIELSKKEIKTIFEECQTLFATANIEKAINISNKYVKKYNCCYDLKLKIAALFYMYSYAMDEKEMKKYCIEIFEDIIENSNKSHLIEQALYQMGVLYSSLGEFDKAEKALNRMNKGELNPNIALANLYSAKNEFKKAREIYQTDFYRNMVYSTTCCMGICETYEKEKNLEKIDRYYSLLLNIKEAFSPHGDFVTGLSFYHMYFAKVYLKFNEKKKSMEAINRMLDFMKRTNINKPQNLASIDCFDEIKDHEVDVKINMYESVLKTLEEKDFDLLRDDVAFKNVIEEIERLNKRYAKV